MNEMMRKRSAGAGRCGTAALLALAGCVGPALADPSATPGGVGRSSLPTVWGAGVGCFESPRFLTTLDGGAGAVTTAYVDWGDVTIGQSVGGIRFPVVIAAAADADSDGDGVNDSLADVNLTVQLLDRENGQGGGRVPVLTHVISSLPALPLSDADTNGDGVYNAAQDGFSAFVITIEFAVDLPGGPASARLGTEDLDGDGLGDFGVAFWVSDGAGAPITSDIVGLYASDPLGWPTPVLPAAAGNEDAFYVGGVAGGTVDDAASFAGRRDFGGFLCVALQPHGSLRFELLGAAGDGCAEIDFTLDGVVDSGDLQAFISGFLAGNVAFDLTGDGQVDSGDLQAFITGFLECV